MENTLVIIKPDAVERRLSGEILGRFEKKGLKLVAMRMTRISPKIARRLYAVHEGKPFYERLVAYLTSGPVIVVDLEGKNVVKVVRRLMGPTFGNEAPPGTIRGDFGLSNRFNLVHGSDSPESARMERELFFQESDYVDYELTGERWAYDFSEGEPV